MSINIHKALLIGSTGFLGSHLKVTLGQHTKIEKLDRAIFDLSSLNEQSLHALFEQKKYSHIIICAAISDVEKCYSNQEYSNAVNVEGTRKLLNAARLHNITPIFFSSDYVFSAKATPYNEDDIRNPTTVYGSQKLAIEKYIEDNFTNFLIFRTSKLMSKTAHNKNILMPILKALQSNTPIKCFEDQQLNPVFIEDIASVLQASIDSNLSGVFHLGTRKKFTRFELAQTLATSLKLDAGLIQPIKMSDIKFSEKRPTNNTLNCQKIESATGFRFSEIEDSIEALSNLL